MKNLCFSLGPVARTKQVLDASGQQLPYFRTSDFSNFLNKLENDFTSLLSKTEIKDFKTLFIAASGTGAMDAVVNNFLNSQSKVLVINGGTFGERFVQLCKFYDIPHDELKLDIG